MSERIGSEKQTAEDIMKSGDTGAAIADALDGAGSVSLINPEGGSPDTEDKIEPTPKQEPDFLREFLCIVRELDKPFAEDQHIFTVSSGDGWEVSRMFHANRPVKLPRVLIEAVRENAVIKNKIIVKPDSGFYGNPTRAKEENPGMDYVVEGGTHYLVRSRPRFSIEILSFGNEDLGRIT